ncbi:MAG: hypothetical protein IJA62_04645 [Ruminococcus sp.]|nr:hypothetical protein [Ruminococcus sp.]
MNYSEWSQEYYAEAEKIKRNLGRMKAKLKTVPMNERRTLEDNIHKLQLIYYEVQQTAGYLASIAKEKQSAA